MSEAKAKYLAAKAAFEETFEKHLQNGVEFISDQVFIDPEVEIAPGAVILPGCILRGKTVIGANCVIGPNTLLENTIVEAGSTVTFWCQLAFQQIFANRLDNLFFHFSIS